MIRRITLASLFVLLVAPSAWPKFKEDEQQYLSDQFKAIQDQVTALTTQMQTLNAQLQVLRQNQAQFQAVIDNQQRTLKELDQMVTSMRLGSAEDLSSLKTVITQFKKETLDGFNRLSGVGTVTPQAGGGPGPTTPSTSSTPAQGYVLLVEGDTVTLDTSSLAGIHQGSRLALYKSSDLNTRVGVIEVTQVIEAGKSRAQVVPGTLNAGVRPEFSDVVRPE